MTASSTMPSSLPLSERSQGTCSAAVDGSRSATSECTSSNIGEIAKRVLARSSTPKTKRTIRSGTRDHDLQPGAVGVGEVDGAAVAVVLDVAGDRQRVEPGEDPLL